MAEESIYIVILTFLGAILGGVLTVLIGPWVAKRFKLREEYFVPFQKWCTEFYGDLEEFNDRYIKNEPTNRYSEFSDILVILDYRSLHDTLIHSSQWSGKIKIEKKKASKALTKLLEIVDTFWHYLENTYPLELPSVEGVKEFNKSLKSLSYERRKEIADKIRRHLCEKRTKYMELAPPILNYFIRQIPTNRYFESLRKKPEWKYVICCEDCEGQCLMSSPWQTNINRRKSIR